MMEIIKGLFAEGGPFRVRAILAFVVVGVYAYLAIATDKIPAEDIMIVTLLIVGFYFITRAKNGNS